MVVKWLTKLSPSRIIVLSTTLIVVIGTLLLMMPMSQLGAISFLDTLFTTISAITATGLQTVDLHQYSFLGHCIIAILMQIGSLGIIILTLLIIHLFFESHKKTKHITDELLGLKRKQNIKRMLVFVVVLTLIIELICAVIMFMKLKTDFPLVNALFLSIFHAISAFTNTGFTLFQNSMESYNTSSLMLYTLSFLMLCGAIGFTTLKEGIRYLTSLTKKVRHTFSLSSKIIWKTTFILIFISFLICLTLEYQHAFIGMDIPTKIANALFYVISSMGTGMQTVSSSATRIAMLLLIMIIAYIGGSPGSTGSGIKTTTIAIFIAAIRSVIRGKKHVILRGHRMDIEQVTKAIAMIALSIPFIIFITFLLLVSESNISLLDSMFETVSAFANLGMSTGITNQLSIIGKLLICVTMLMGRVGPFTLIFAIKPLNKD